MGHFIRCAEGISHSKTIWDAERGKILRQEEKNYTKILACGIKDHWLKFGT